MTDAEKIVPIDHLLKRAEQNKLTPREAQDLDRVLRSEPSPEGVYAPITLASPTEVAPVAYVIHKRSSRCLACNAMHFWSEIYALNHLRSRTGKTFVRNMIPVHRLEWQVPLQVHELKQRETPFCHECMEAAQDYLTTLPEPPIPDAVLNSPHADAPTNAPKAEKKKTFTSAKDLLF